MEVSCLRLVKASLFLIVLNVYTTSALIIKSATKEVCKSEECLAAAKILENSIDTKVNPCDDFYQYACGNWPKNYGKGKNPTKQTDSFQLRSIQNDKEILEFLKQNNTPDEHESVHKTRQLYTMCLDRKFYSGIEQLLDILSSIGLPIVPISTNENADFDYVRLLAKATKLAGIEKFFRAVRVKENSFNGSLVEIVITEPTSEVALFSQTLIGKKVIVKKEEEKNFMEKVIKKMCEVSTLSSCTENDSNLKSKFSRQTEERTRIINKSRIPSFIPTLYTLQELQNISDDIADKVKSSIPKFNWTKYIEEIFNESENVYLDLRTASNVQIVVYEMSFIEDMIKFIHQRSIEEIEFQLWWDVVSTLLPYADFDIFQAKNNITSLSRHEEICKEISIQKFKMVASYIYLKKEKYQKAKIEVETMLENIKQSYKKIFEQATWLDEKTRDKALIKLESMVSLVAYLSAEELSPILEEMYGNINITYSFLDTVITNGFTTKNPILSLALVNAFYAPQVNMIIIPGGLLGPPLLYTDALKALIYGSIGFVTGHEITHGFDQNGGKYNPEGKIEDWWSNETSAKYEEKSTCFLKAYNTYNSTFNGIWQKVNSSITLNEDMTDNVGFKAALFAYRRHISENGNEPSLHNFEDFTSEQLFSLAFANIWCESPNMYNSLMASAMDHSPGGVRVNGVFKNSEELSSIWNCPKGTNMNPSDEKCSLF